MISETAVVSRVLNKAVISQAAVVSRVLNKAVFTDTIEFRAERIE